MEKKLGIRVRPFEDLVASESGGYLFTREELEELLTRAVNFGAEYLCSDQKDADRIDILITQNVAGEEE